MTKPFILGTAGHIDHGKSTLVKVLTGTDPDRLPEEKARGMTIELGFAHFDVTDPEEQGTTYSLGVVDVPGHADFVKNMLAGVSGLDVALFIVAADDGWMPQSEEHLQILSYLGIERAVVALTKADLAEDIAFSVEMLREELKGTLYETAPIVPVSALKGTGLAELKAALARVLRGVPAPADVAKPRLHVDRAFSPTGVGTVVTGTLAGGQFAAGAEVAIMPAGLKSHVRSIQSHKSVLGGARPGMRTALNLSDAPLATRTRKDGVKRGDVITLAALGPATMTLDVMLEKSPRPVPGQPGFTRPLRTGMKVRVHHGSACHDARLHLLGTRSLEPGQSTPAELRFDAPVHTFDGDRFVLRDWSKRFTIAGGVILDAAARRGDFRKAKQRQFLESRALAPDDALEAVLATIERGQAIPRDGLLVRSRFSEKQIQQAVDAGKKSGRLVSEASWLLEKTWWDERMAAAGTIVKAHHAAHQESPGFPLSELRASMEKSLPDPRLLDLLVSQLARNGFSRQGELIRFGEHKAELPPVLQTAAEKLRAIFAANPLDPPNPKELAPGPEEQKALKFMIQTKECIDLGEKAVITREIYDHIRLVTLGLIKEKGQVTASEIREAVGTTRRILIPLLERFDKEGITKRAGDLRTAGRNAG